VVTEGPRDLAGYLPLSARPRVDESHVTGDWGPRLEELLVSIDALTASLPPGTPGRPEVWVARERLTAAVSAVPSGRRVKVPALGAVLVEALEFAAITGGRLTVDPITSGAVALDRSLRASHAIRAVINGRTVHAFDADWSFGSGPELSGTAEELVLFLYGRAGVPPG
jgi:hypothetical protein